MSNFSDQLATFEKILDEYNDKLGLGNLKYNDEVEKILSLTREDLLLIQPHLIYEYSFILNQYNVLLRMERNRNNVRLFWAENQLEKYVAKYHDTYANKYMKSETIKASIILSDTGADKLSKIILHAKSRILEVDGVLEDIKMFINILNNIARLKNER